MLVNRSAGSLGIQDFPLHMVVAVADNHVMGLSDGLPWRLSHDLQRFKRLTIGHTMLMGRRTFDSIGRVLPGRTTIVLTRQPGYEATGAWVANGIEAALERLPANTIPFVVGGAEIYRAAWPHVGAVHITRVRAQVPGDTYLDPIDLSEFRRVELEHVPADAKNDWPSDYEFWVRQEPFPGVP